MLDLDPAAGRSEQIARRFAAALEAGDVDAALTATSPDVVFHSPVVHRPYEGRDTLGAILRGGGTDLRGFPLHRGLWCR